MNVQELILALQQYWTAQGCLLGQPYDMEKGAGTFNPATFLRALGPEPISVAYIEPCRRPADGRYGENPIRMQHYFQFQVIMKPNPDNFVDLYLGSLKAIGVDPLKHDLRFVHDDWETAALGAWGLGWEVWCDGTEITQFTYFQQVGGVDLSVISGEITYGVERLAMFLQKKKSVFDLNYNNTYTYGDIYHQNEVQFSRFNFELADTNLQRQLFGLYEAECARLCELKNAGPALDFAMKASHSFNLLDARGAISVNERQSFVLRIRTLAKAIAEAWLEEREKLGHPFNAKLAKLTSQVSGLEKVVVNTSSAKDEKPLSANAPLLIELGVEEMPAKVFESLHAQLPVLWNKLFSPLGIAHTPFEFHTTPRRIVVYSGSIATGQADSILEIKGPPLTQAKDATGAWTGAAKGWAQKNGLDLNSVEIKRIGNADYLYTQKTIKGKPTKELLADLIPQLFGQIHWYKTMRWGMGTEAAFVRPVAWLVALLGNHIIPTSFAGKTSSNISRGHRFLAPANIEVSANTYFEQLKKAFVVVRHADRMAEIRAQIEKTCIEHKWIWKPDEDLLDQVSHLVEFPYLVVGSFAPEYLSLPEAVLITEMKEHQRYFAVHKPDGSIHHHFMAVSNGARPDMTEIIDGYETVLVSRLRDGRFFIEDDLKKSLNERREKLHELTFATGLGSVYDKSVRIETLCTWITKEANTSTEDTKTTLQSAVLCKADLVSAMVGEFPELQGLMGAYYAQREGLSSAISTAISEHYQPRGEKDNLPQSVPGAIIALADRIDTLVGLFCIGKIPTGSADPFALRRACLGIISIIVQQNFRFSLTDLFKESLNTYTSVKKDEPAVLKQLLDFTQTRLRVLLHENKRPGVPGGIPKDTIEAVLASSSDWVSLYRTTSRIEILQKFREAGNFMDLAATFRRLDRILDRKVTATYTSSLCVLTEEKAIDTWLNTNESKLATLWEKDAFAESLELLSSLRSVVDQFFEKVMVNDPDEKLRQNRQALLAKVYQLVLHIADFSKFQIAE